ncbi:MAG: Uncharacterised protein [Methanobacteriota archaeon]|nr:hypothetical protein [Euryarchaeota archaeon]CAI8233227.1 MAG: Uncharacterised protein [Euryarchaeota archaeon]|tara:strand:- start:795 stop:1073 length:279 start_codon:yes stop_codon:yes gene_type:complete
MEKIDEIAEEKIRLNDEGLAELLIEVANFRHPNLKLLPLELGFIKPYSDEIDSTDSFGVLGKMHSFTVSARLGNGDVTKTVAISLLISVSDC